MSIAEQLNRLKGIRDTISTKLKSIGVLSTSISNPKYEDCKNAINSIIDNTNKKSTTNYIDGIFYHGHSGAIFSKGLKGYSDENTVVRVPVTNLIPSNIKKGVNVGGVIGTLEEVPQKVFMGVLQYKSLKNNSSSATGKIYDATGETKYRMQQSEDNFISINIVGNIVLVHWLPISSTRDTQDCIILERAKYWDMILITGPNPKVGFGMML